MKDVVLKELRNQSEPVSAGTLAAKLRHLFKNDPEKRRGHFYRVQKALHELCDEGKAIKTARKHEYFTNEPLSEREAHILTFMYKNDWSCTIDDGNILAWYSDKYDDWKTEGDTQYDDALQSLINRRLVDREEPPLACFLHITEKGKLTHDLVRILSNQSETPKT